MARFTDDYLLYLLAQASHRASAEFHARLAGQGVAVSTWRILATLYPDSPATIGELARSCLAKQPTMTRQVARLEAQGLVKRRMAEGDRRRVVVRLTEKGRNMAAGLAAQARAHEMRLLAGLGEEAAARLKETLRGLLSEKGGSA
ncbi:DNA-binding transcriptional regulator, MarR family [Meinhardsimonia xiamenensis]|jgi:DNA-binding MarR family transcriptional regulator|uniref:DNA-binding transcriptional regulator, MarR family n=1 Tax=Meinhardsimonia xiamenensis TaxID=990712 RepID=A0A1G8YL87_9RHOB|nr:MarR family winged helix-turn-helix transcriptional regulator [Meinhardsimonia xiamenensis]PRX37324.1 DNA-binding MarR family transcriptional regulator [Meinhardsimonia xiamenensis]SDK02830.1 DNA-binding transcriptional regulator, MarR family [Meinhardsimonia xiamenensis]